MPAPVRELISAPPTTDISIALEPAFNAVESLLLLTEIKAEKYYGFNEWVNRTRESLSMDERHVHELVMIGFYYAVLPEGSWSSFPAYLDHLAAMNPITLRDKLLHAYATLACRKLDEGDKSDIDVVTQDFEAILKSVDTYLDFICDCFDGEHIDVELESKAYTYTIDPPALQELIVSHLRHMWDEYLAPEWTRVRPMLEDCVQAFKQLDFNDMNKRDTAQLITDQDVSEDHWADMIEKAEQVIFVPSAHIGPYPGGFLVGDSMYILFGARLPKGAQVYAPDLSRTDILVRLTALADDNRLRILKFVADNGEQRSQEIMEHLDLSQSASSRHLKQLSATGLIIERRCNGAKCYELNPERIDDTLQAVGKYLMGT